MPQIRTFEAPQLGLQPTEIGVDATAQSANRIGRFSNQVAAGTEQVGDQFARNLGSAIKDAGNVAVQYAEHREISHGAAAFAQLNDNLTNAWNDTAKNADPNDPSVAAKFRETVLEPALEKYRDSFMTEGGQKFAEARVDALRNHMFEKTSADMSSLAKVAVSQNIHEVANRLSNTAVQDPTSVDHLLSSADSMVGGVVSSSPNIKGADSAKARIELSEKMKESIVRSGAFGAIQKAADPEAEAARWAQKYPQYINGQEELTLARAAKTQARTNLALEKQTQLYQKQLDELNTHKAANDAFTKNVSIDAATNKPIISPQYFKDALDIAKNNPNAPNAATVAKTMIDWGEAQQRARNEVIQTDPATQRSLYDGIFSVDKPTTKIDVLRAEADHKLSNHDSTVLRSLIDEVDGAKIKGPIYQTAIDGAKERLGVSTMVDGHERYAMFMQSFWPEYIRQKNAGTLPANALDLKDPKSLISQSMKPYEPTAAERLQAFALKKMPIDSLNLTGPNKTITGVEVKNAPALPAMAERVKDRVYDTPRGKMKWTGTGWLPAQ